MIYRQIAKILLELSRHDFDKIGAPSLVEHGDGTTSWSVASAPMTLKMNEIERGGYVQVGGKNSSTPSSDQLPLITPQIISQNLFKPSQNTLTPSSSKIPPIYTSRGIL
jgi:hypothetical protein